MSISKDDPGEITLEAILAQTTFPGTDPNNLEHLQDLLTVAWFGLESEGPTLDQVIAEAQELSELPPGSISREQWLKAIEQLPHLDGFPNE